MNDVRNRAKGLRLPLIGLVLAAAAANCGSDSGNGGAGTDGGGTGGSGGGATGGSGGSPATGGAGGSATGGSGGRPATGGAGGSGGTGATGGSGTGGTGTGGAAPAGAITIAAAGDWDDKFGAAGVTEISVKNGAKHDLILMLGDLSYAGVPANFAGNTANAMAWCGKVNPLAGMTPIVFVPGDHDSKNQDGDNLTYAGCLNKPAGAVMAPTGVAPGGGAYVGKYPFLWYLDVVKAGVTVRVVGSSVAYEEAAVEAAADQPLLRGYQKGGPNYTWLSQVFADAKMKGHWILHTTHLPCIDMGKNTKIHTNCQDVIDLVGEAGVHVHMDASSHNVWRTKQLKQGPGCPSIILTTTAGANPMCAKDNPTSAYNADEGFVNAHAGAAGKTSASSPGTNCSNATDSKVDAYGRPGACYVNGTPGVVSMTFTAKMMSGSYVMSAAPAAGVDYSKYAWTMTRP